MNTAAQPFLYSFDECDVHDRLGLVEYRRKRLQWLSWLQGDPHHSISGQLYRLMRHDAAFRLFNEARRFSTPEKPTSAVAPLLASMLDQGFVASQILQICKLVDGDPKVISVRRLLNDMRKHRSLVTREFFVCHDGLPYDVGAAAKRVWAGMPLSVDKAIVTSMPTTGPDAYDSAEHAHAVFDRLSGTAEDRRCRKDMILKSAFEQIEERLEDASIKKLRILRNKFVAHAADENSRASAGVDAFGVSLKELEAAQRCVVGVAQRIELDLLMGSDRRFVGFPGFTDLEHLELPFLPDDRKEEMQAWWESHLESRRNWRMQ